MSIFNTIRRRLSAGSGGTSLGGPTVDQRSPNTGGTPTALTDYRAQARSAVGADQLQDFRGHTNAQAAVDKWNTQGKR